jgi:hypothetical protein
MLLAIALIGAGAWFWLDSLRCREIAISLCQATCQRHNLQFLDETVALHSLRPYRNPRGRWWLIERLYRFEFTADGYARQPGAIRMRGVTPVWIDLPGYTQGTGMPRVVPLFQRGPPPENPL